MPLLPQLSAFTSSFGVEAEQLTRAVPFADMMGTKDACVPSTCAFLALQSASAASQAHILAFWGSRQETHLLGTYERILKLLASSCYLLRALLPHGRHFRIHLHLLATGYAQRPARLAHLSCRLRAECCEN